MTREEMAQWCERMSKTPHDSAVALRRLAEALRLYQAQTHTETHALEEIFETAVLKG